MTMPPVSHLPSQPASGAQAASVSCSCLTTGQHQQVTPSTLWLPVHEARERWATFIGATSSTRALAATGHALLALGWEQRAHYHYQQGKQQECWGFLRAMDCSLEEAQRNLHAALHRWHPCHAQLGWLIHQSPARLAEEGVEQETLRSLLMEIAQVQRRLGMLYDQIQQEREVCAHG